MQRYNISGLYWQSTSGAILHTYALWEEVIKETNRYAFIWILLAKLLLQPRPPRYRCVLDRPINHHGRTGGCIGEATKEECE